MTTTPNTPRAPSHLSKRSKGIWKVVHRDFAMDDASRVLLRAGLEHLDLHDQAMETLRRDGPTIAPETGGLTRAHPAARIAKDALSSFRLTFKQLGIDYSPEGL